MIESRTTQSFRTAFAALPEEIQAQARRAYRLFRADSAHPWEPEPIGSIQKFLRVEVLQFADGSETLRSEDTMDNNIVNSPIPELFYPESAPGRRGTRHERKCAVCRHPEREAIEEAFLHWHSPTEIATDYELPDLRPIYRHAHATGLFARRQRNVSFALENLIERVNEIQVVTPGAIIQAIRAYTRISKNGEWIEPPRQIIVTHVTTPEDPGSQGPIQTAGQLRAAESAQVEPDIMQIITPKPPNPNRHSAIRTHLNPLKTKEGAQV